MTLHIWSDNDQKKYSHGYHIWLFFIDIFGKHQCFGLDSECMFAQLVLLNGKLGVMRVVTSQ